MNNARVRLALGCSVSQAGAGTGPRLKPPPSNLLQVQHVPEQPILDGKALELC